MAIIRCKMCGGDLKPIEGCSTVKCEYCGIEQTIPKADDEKKLLLFERAERLRRGCEFDKAAGLFEAIIADFPEEADAYWGLVLCKYGIEYVDDPATGNKIPTCHRSSFDSVMDDSDFEQALENADSDARRVYRAEAKRFEEIRKGIISVSQSEEPYDIFICYKETAENGDRTIDSVIAQDTYEALTARGYRVFFARITLEDKLGVEYEPYIFAALNSAKIMLAFGTDYEYYNAVWVKNEWSRYLKLMEKDKEKHLIPCYKGIDAYDIPKEFAHLQAQDMGKVGAMQDLIRGIEKILPADESLSKAPVTSVPGPVPSVDSYLQRAYMFLEDEEWYSADEYFEKVLDIDPQCARAYLGKLMAELHVRTQEELAYQPVSFEDNKNCQKALRFADSELKASIEGYLEAIRDRLEKDRLERERMAEEARIAAEQKRLELERLAEEERLERKKKAEEERLAQKKKAEEERLERKKKAEEERLERERRIKEEQIALLRKQESAYNEATDFINAKKYKEAILLLKKADGYSNSYELLADCNSILRKKRNKRIAVSFVIIVLLAALSIFVIYPFVPFALGNYKPYINLYNIKEFKVPEGVTSIGDSAFYGCERLKKITIPDSVKSISDYAFYNCNGLESITIPDSVGGIGNYAFYGCDRIESIIVPDSVTSIGENAFSKKTFLVISDDKKNKLIEEYRTCVIVPNGITSIEEGAFSSCGGIKSITIQDSVTSIGGWAFSSCGGLESITIPDSVTSIGESAFFGCYGLKSITIPSSVTSIGKSAFSFCNVLESIIFNGTRAEWRALTDEVNIGIFKATVICSDGQITH